MRPKLASNYPMAPGKSRGAPLDIHDTDSQSAFTVPDSLTPPESLQSFRPVVTAPTYIPGLFGDGQLQLIVFPAAGATLVLPRPSQFQRVLLIIVNDIAGFNIRVNFDTPANVTVGLPIPPGGNLFMDNVVVQNDVWVFAPVAGNVQVAFMNVDVTNIARLG